MTYKKHIFYPLTMLLLLLASACSQEEKLGDDSMDKGLTISMTIATATSGSDTKATTIPLPGENSFDNAHLLIYKQGAGITDLPILVRSTTMADQTEFEFSIAGTELQWQQGSDYDICIIAGLPAGTTAPDMNTSKGKLMRLTAGRPEGITPTGTKMIFTGTAQFTYQYVEGGLNIKVPLQRIVARVDIQLSNMNAGRVAKVYLSDIAATTPYWGGISNVNGYYNIEATQDATDEGLYRAYINENYMTPTSKKAYVWIVIADADGSNEVAYQPIIINNGTIERNTIYEMQLDVLIEYDPVINVSQSRVEMDWLNLGQKFDTSVDYDSDATMSFVGYVIKNADGTDLSVTTDGSNLPMWLPKANITGLPDGTGQTGKITLTYTVAETSQYEVALRIRAKNTSRETTKDITVVYDNGYLPNSVLSSPGLWITSLPTSGIHLAKRGNVLTTDNAGAEDPESVWSTNETKVLGTNLAHGTGVQNTTQIVNVLSEASVARVCNTMGLGWYLSSAAELITIRNVKQYLGTSYLINSPNNLNYWSSSQSTSADAGSYALNFNGIDIVAPSYLKSSIYRVRCVRNI